MATPSSRHAPPSPSTPAAPPEHIIGKFKRMDHIGKGSFAEVYRGIHVVRSASLSSQLPPDRLADPLRKNAPRSPSSRST